MARRPASETSVIDKLSERKLISLQRKLAQAQHVKQQRDALLAKMSSAGYTHYRLAALVNAANEQEGVPTVTDDAVFKALRRQRKRSEDGTTAVPAEARSA